MKVEIEEVKKMEVGFSLECLVEVFVLLLGLSKDNIWLANFEDPEPVGLDNLEILEVEDLTVTEREVVPDVVRVEVALSKILVFFEGFKDLVIAVDELDVEELIDD